MTSATDGYVEDESDEYSLNGQPLIPEGFVPSFGVPYARANEDGTKTCPRCGANIRQTQRKDFESYSGSEYADHYDALHALADGRILVDGVWYERWPR